MARPINTFNAGDPILAEKVNENFEEVWAGVNIYGESLEGSDSYAIIVEGVEEYSKGMAVAFKADVANTGNCSININGLGAKEIRKIAGGSLVVLSDSDIEAGQIVYLIYDGTYFQYVNYKEGYRVSKGSGTRSVSSYGEETIGHNLGKVPKKIVIKAILPTEESRRYSDGVWVNGDAVALCSDGIISETFIINLGHPGSFIWGEIISSNSTNFVIRWSGTGSLSGEVKFIWYAEG